VIGGDGNPVIAYYEGGIGLKVAACTNPTCAHDFGGNVAASIHTPDDLGKSHTSIVITSNHPTQHWPLIILDRSSNELGSVVCYNPRCEAAGSGGGSSWASPDRYTLDSVSANGSYSSVAVNNLGRPVISYYDADNGDLKVMVCDTVKCTATRTVSTIDSGGNVGWYTSVAVRNNNVPVIAYFDITNGKLKVAECNNVNCTSALIKTIGDADPAGTSIAIGNDGRTIVSYIDDHDLKVAIIPVG